jgi:MFS family permease
MTAPRSAPPAPGSVPGSAPARRSRPLGANFTRLWSAAAVSSVGIGVHFASFPLLAAQVASSPGQLSVVTAVGSAPWLLLALPAGAWADRGNPRRIMICANLGRALVLAALSAGLASHIVGIAAVLVTSGLLGIGEVLFDCASLTFLPQVVPEAELERANARLFTGTQTGQNLIGQLVGGTLFRIARILPFSGNCVSLTISAIVLARVRAPAPVASPAQRRHLAAELAEGIKVVRRNRPFLSIIGVSALMNGVYLGELAVLVLYSDRVLRLSPVYYGALLTAQAVGAVAGGAAASRVIRALGRALSLLLSLIAIGGTSVALGLAPDIATAFAAFAVMGAASMIWNVISVSYRQTLVPPSLRGRANGVYRLVSWGAMPLGSLAFGAAADVWGLRTPFVVGGLLVGMSSLVLIPILPQIAAGRVRSESGT